MEPNNNNSRMEEERVKSWTGETYTCHICFRVFKDKKALIFHVAQHRRAKVIPISGLRLQQQQQQKLQPTIIRPPQKIQYVLVKPQQGFQQRNYQPQQQQQDLFLKHIEKPNYASSNNNNKVVGGDFNLKIINTVSLAEKQKELIKKQVKEGEKEKDPLAFLAPASKISNQSVRTLNLVKTSSPSLSQVKTELTATTPVQNTLYNGKKELVVTAPIRKTIINTVKKQLVATAPVRKTIINNVKKTKPNTKNKNWFEEILKLSRNSDKLPNFGILCPDIEIDIDPQQDEEHKPSFDKVIKSRGNSSMEKDLQNEEEEDENEEGFEGVMEMGDDDEEEENPVTQIISKLINNKNVTTNNRSKQQQNPNLSSSSSASSSSFYQQKVVSPKEINKKQQQQQQPIKKDKIKELNDIKQMDSNRRTKTRIIKKPMKLAEFYSSDFVTTDELEGINLKKKKSPTKNPELSFKRSPNIGVIACPYPNCIRKFSTRGNMIRHTRINHVAP